MKNEKVFYDSTKFPFHIWGSLEYQDTNTKGRKISDLHFHEEYEFLYCSRGVFECTIDSVCHKLFQGDIIFINSRVPHETSRQDNTTSAMLQFRPPYSPHDSLRYLRRFSMGADNPLYIFRKGLPETTEIEKCMVNIFREQKNKPNAFEHFITANIYMILAILYGNNIISADAVLPDSVNISKILPVIEFVEENFDRPITVDDAANVLNINKSYFCRLFRKVCSCTFTEYLNFVRVCKAEHMLKKGAGIADTAYNVGFSSQSYFNKLFKKYKLCSPTEYKHISKLENHAFL